MSLAKETTYQSENGIEDQQKSNSADNIAPIDASTPTSNNSNTIINVGIGGISAKKNVHKCFKRRINGLHKRNLLSENYFSKDGFEKAEKHGDRPDENAKSAESKAKRKNNPGDLRKNLNNNTHRITTSERKKRPDKPDKEKNKEDHNETCTGGLNIRGKPIPENRKLYITEDQIPD